MRTCSRPNGRRTNQHEAMYFTHSQWCRGYGITDGMSHVSEGLFLLPKEFSLFYDDFPEITVFDLSPISLGRRGKARWDRNAILSELGHHFAKARVLAPHAIYIGGSELVKPFDEGCLTLVLFQFFHDFVVEFAL